MILSCFTVIPELADHRKRANGHRISGLPTFPDRSAMLRPAFVVLHRFVGLTIAAFLFVSGLTGAIISWDHELDELINPHLVEAPGRGPFLDPLVLADKLAADEPNSFVTYVPLHTEEGHSLPFGVEPR